MTWIAFLRGINVGGSKKIKMADLKALFEKINCEKIQTYLQSGNVVFESPLDKAILTKKIETAINHQYGFEVEVFLRTAAELEKIIRDCPFKNNVDFFHVTLLRESPDPQKVSALNLKKDDAEAFEIIGQEIYLYCPNGYGRTKLTNNAFEKKLGVKATTRNWRTINSMLELSVV